MVTAVLESNLKPPAMTEPETEAAPSELTPEAEESAPTLPASAK